MQRWPFIAAGLLIVAIAIGLLIRDEPVISPASAESTETDDAPAASPAVRVAAARTGALSGFVKRDGVGVPHARVFVKASIPFTVETLDDGAFRIDGVPPEPVFVSAAKDNVVSSALGPFVVEPGKTTEGLVLELLPTVMLEGVVRDFVTRAPVQRATISWSGGATQTNEQGAFQLPAPKSQIWLEVLARGYLPRTEWVSLELARAGGRLELVMSPISVIEGQVVEQGTARPQVSVWAEITEGVHRGERSAAVLTDKKGSFRIECAAGLRRLVAVTPAGVMVPGPEVRLAIGETVKDVVVELGELGQLTGVVSREGEPLRAASLTLVNAITEDVVSTTSTMIDGRFSFGAVPGGRYLLQVRAGSFSTIAGPHDHQRGGEPWVVEVKKGNVLNGNVSPASAGVRVRWRSGEWAGPATETVTNAEGEFQFEGVPAGELLVDAEGPEGAATEKATAGKQVSLRLVRGSVLVRIVDESGGIVADATIIARNEVTGAVRKYVLMAPDGVFQIDLPYGAWVVFAEVAGRGRTGQAYVNAGGPQADVRLVLMATNSIVGRVVDKASKLPLQNVRVRAESQMGRSSVTTDARGSFTLPPQPAAVVLVFGRDGYEQQSRSLFSPGDAQNLIVELTPNKAAGEYRDEAQRFEGVGMTLQRAPDGRILVQVVNEGSPAERAGVHSGDQITFIDGIEAGSDLQNVVSRIRGPSGTPVRLGFIAAGQPREVIIRRKSLLITYW